MRQARYGQRVHQADHVPTPGSTEARPRNAPSPHERRAPPRRPPERPEDQPRPDGEGEPGLRAGPSGRSGWPASADPGGGDAQDPRPLGLTHVPSQLAPHLLTPRLPQLRLPQQHLTQLHLTQLHLTQLHLTQLHLTQLHLTQLHLTQLHLTQLRLTQLRLTQLRLTWSGPPAPRRLTPHLLWPQPALLPSWGPPRGAEPP
jgi:hypothetical protein